MGHSFRRGDQITTTRHHSDLTAGTVYTLAHGVDSDGDVQIQRDDVGELHWVPATTCTPVRCTSAPAAESPLRDLATLITALSYTDMMRLAAELTDPDTLLNTGAVNATAQRLLNAAANLASA